MWLGATLRGANCRFGGYGASSGAKMAMMIQARMMVIPIMRQRLPPGRPQGSPVLAGEPLLAGISAGQRVRF